MSVWAGSLLGACSNWRCGGDVEGCAPVGCAGEGKEVNEGHWGSAMLLRGGRAVLGITVSPFTVL